MIAYRVSLAYIKFLVKFYFWTVKFLVGFFVGLEKIFHPRGWRN